MATTQKGWRKVVVDGVDYKWAVSRKFNCFENAPCPSSRFTVESAVGALLIVELNRPIVDPWRYLHLSQEMKPVTPHEVANEVRNAIADGYDPMVKAKPFTRCCK